MKNINTARLSANYVDQLKCTFLFQLIKHYEVRPDPTGKTVKPITRTLLAPATSIDLQFIDRQVRQKTPAKAQTAAW